MVRTSNTDSRRDEIADALARVMARTGYGGASVAAIAKEAGLTPGLLHYHYASKAEMLEVLVGRVTGSAQARIDALSVQAGSPRDRLHAVSDGMLALGPGSDADAVALWTQIGAEAVRNPEIRTSYGAWVSGLQEQLVSRVRDVCSAESRSEAEAPQIATALLALVEGLFGLAAASSVIEAGSAATLARRTAVALISAQPQDRVFA